MKKLLFFIGLITPLSLFASNFVADSTELPGVLLRHGTAVIFRLQYPLASEKIQENQQIPIDVAQEVVVGRDRQVMTAIGSGQVGYAVAEIVQRRGIFGQAAAVTLRPTHVTTEDGTLTQVDGEAYTVYGKSRKGIAWGIGIAFPLVGIIAGMPYLLPLGLIGLLIKGKNVKLNLTTRMKGAISEDIRVLKAK